MTNKKFLPEGWVVTNIGEICASSQYGYTAKATSSGNIHFLRTTDITSGYIDWATVPYCAIPTEYEAQYLLMDGDVVISRAGSVGFSSLIKNPQRSIFASYLIRFRPFINPDYFNYFLKTPTYWEAISERSLGIAVQNVNATKLAGIEIPIAPVAEQSRIVTKLEELFSDLDAGVAELKAAQKKLTQYRQSLLKAAVEGKLTAEWRAERAKRGEPLETGAQLLESILAERRRRWEEKQLAKFKEQGKTPPKDWRDKYPEPVKPNTADLPELPEGWVWASLDQCAIDEGAITDGPFGSNLKSSHYTESGPRVIRLQNIGDGVFIDARAHISDEHYRLLKKHAVVEKDAIVAMLGEILPRACLVPPGIAPAIVKADCARVRLNPSLTLPELMNVCLNSQPIRERVAGLAKGIGRPRINLSHTRAICIPIPPLYEQYEIVRIISTGLEAITQQLDAISLAMRQAEAQRQNILKAAFSGQLVPQDPNDEPASVLLERIRAERAARESGVGRRGRRKAREDAA